MFDKLIVSEPEGADFKNRRNYFMVSSLVVGALFLAAVVVSIFASDYGLGNGGFELAEILPPVEMAAVEQDVPKPRPPQAPAQTQSQVPERKIIMARTDEPIPPISTSTVPNTELARPNTSFVVGKNDTNPAGNQQNVAVDNGPGQVETPPAVVQPPVIPDPPQITVPSRVPPVVSKGVINSKAISLPIPNYPAAAIAINAQGKVDVQVMIDESGKVISAHAIDGHPLLRNAAEQAARNARFTPTFLSDVAVKVTGVIIYSFNRN